MPRQTQTCLPSAWTSVVWWSTALPPLCASVTQGPPCHLPSTTAWEHRNQRACTLSALEIVTSTSSGTVTNPVAEHITTGRKGKQSHATSHASNHAMLCCFHRTLASCSATLTRADINITLQDTSDKIARIPIPLSLNTGNLA